VSIGESSPDASFTFSQETGEFNTSTTGNGAGDNNVTTVRVTHNSGDAVQINQLVAKVSGNKSDPQSNDSVYQIEYEGDGENDGWKPVLDDSTGDRTVFKPGDSFVIGFYGVNEEEISGDITSYRPDGFSPPGDELQLGSGGSAVRGQKLGECDLVEIVWRSDSGAQGQVLQTYQLPGTECA
jgi:hypothetical protein